MCNKGLSHVSRYVNHDIGAPSYDYGWADTKGPVVVLEWALGRGGLLMSEAQGYVNHTAGCVPCTHVICAYENLLSASSSEEEADSPVPFLKNEQAAS